MYRTSSTVLLQGSFVKSLYGGSCRDEDPQESPEAEKDFLSYEIKVLSSTRNVFNY